MPLRFAESSPERYVHPIAAYRKKHDLTLEELGALCKPPILKYALSRIENGLRKPTFDQINGLVEATGGAVTADMIIRATPREVAA